MKSFELTPDNFHDTDGNYLRITGDYDITVGDTVRLYFSPKGEEKEVLDFYVSSKDVTRKIYTLEPLGDDGNE